MNIGFTLEDCKAPTSARVSALMADFVTFFKGVSKSELSQAPFDMLNKLGEHPEIHADSMADNAMLKMGCVLNSTNRLAHTHCAVPAWICC